MRKTGLFSIGGMTGMAMAAMALTQSGTVMAAGDPALGAKLYAQCRTCHTITKGGPNTLGPNLSGIVGAKSAQKAGFKYSPAMMKANIVWTPQKLDAWLAKPSAVVPGSKMAFAGVSDAQKRASIIAYLATQK